MPLVAPATFRCDPVPPNAGGVSTTCWTSAKHPPPLPPGAGAAKSIETPRLKPPGAVAEDGCPGADGSGAVTREAREVGSLAGERRGPESDLQADRFAEGGNRPADDECGRVGRDERHRGEHGDYSQE